LNRGGKRHYHAFFAALEIFADRCHALDSVWFIGTDWSAGRSSVDSMVAGFLRTEVIRFAFCGGVQGQGKERPLA
jgi:hypothetical protein